MAEWISPIYDRTQADIDYAKSQLNLKNNIYELKGCFNLTDLHRIEDNTRYLADTLNEMYYFNTVITNNSAVISNVPQTKGVNRIINNVAILWDKYYKPTGAVNLPSSMLHYEHINSIEKNLYLLKKHIDDMVGYFKECNTFECGEE